MVAAICYIVFMVVIQFDNLIAARDDVGLAPARVVGGTPPPGLAHRATCLVDAELIVVVNYLFASTVRSHEPDDEI